MDVQIYRPHVRAESRCTNGLASLCSSTSPNLTPAPSSIHHARALPTDLRRAQVCSHGSGSLSLSFQNASIASYCRFHTSVWISLSPSAARCEATAAARLCRCTCCFWQPGPGGRYERPPCQQIHSLRQSLSPPPRLICTSLPASPLAVLHRLPHFGTAIKLRMG